LCFYKQKNETLSHESHIKRIPGIDFVFELYLARDLDSREDFMLIYQLRKRVLNRAAFFRYKLPG